MKGFRRFLGVVLLASASVAMGAAKALYALGRAVMPTQDANGPQDGSPGSGRVLYPHTVMLRDGRYVTLYGEARKL